MPYFPPGYMYPPPMFANPYAMNESYQLGSTPGITRNVYSTGTGGLGVQAGQDSTGGSAGKGSVLGGVKSNQQDEKPSLPVESMYISQQMKSNPSADSVSQHMRFNPPADKPFVGFDPSAIYKVQSNVGRGAPTVTDMTKSNIGSNPATSYRLSTTVPANGATPAGSISRPSSNLYRYGQGMAGSHVASTAVGKSIPAESHGQTTGLSVPPVTDRPASPCLLYTSPSPRDRG